MNNVKRIIVLSLIAVTLIAMFLPVATFRNDASGQMNEQITKQQGKVDSAQKQLDRWIKGGKKTEAEIEGQRKEVEKQQAKLDELKAQQEAMADQSDEGALTYALLPSALPGELEIDQTVLNESGIYTPNFPAYYAIRWVAFGLLTAAAVLILLAGSKQVSKLYTFSSFLHLLGIILLGYTIIRLGAFPIKTPLPTQV